MRFDYYENSGLFLIQVHRGRYIGRHDRKMNRREAVRTYGESAVKAGEFSAMNCPHLFAVVPNRATIRAAEGAE